MTIIQRIIEHDHAAFRELHGKYEQPLFQYLEQQLGCGDTAAEVAQRCFIKIWERRQSLDASVPEQAIVFRMAKTSLIDYIRQRNRELKRLYEWSAEPGRTSFTSSDIEGRELSRKVFQTIEQLPPIRRKVFTMHRMDGYTYQEIARQLHISVKSVENHLSKSVRFLRESLQAEGYTTLLISLLIMN